MLNPEAAVKPSVAALISSNLDINAKCTKTEKDGTLDTFRSNHFPSHEFSSFSFPLFFYPQKLNLSAV